MTFFVTALASKTRLESIAGPQDEIVPASPCGTPSSMPASIASISSSYYSDKASISSSFLASNAANSSVLFSNIQILYCSIIEHIDM